MSKARHTSKHLAAVDQAARKRKMNLNNELRELAQDHDAALYMVAVLTAKLTTEELAEVLDGTRLAAAKLL